MFNRARTEQLPALMADRARLAREIACSEPKSIDVDDDLLPWVYDKESELWLSFDGNYSRKSPESKREAARIAEEKRLAYEASLQEKYDTIKQWSQIRQDVLDRDQHTCQLCGAEGKSKLHIHHILKRKNGGTDHYDNLLTVCPKCHFKAEGELYDPDWTVPPAPMSS